MSRVKYEVTKFNGDSGFSTWQRRMRDLFIQQGLHKALGDKSKKLESMKLEDWEEMDEKAASAIRLHLTDVVINNIIDEESASNLGVKIEEEDKAIVLLNSFPSSYDNLATTILHGKDSIELKDVTSTFLLNEKMRKKPENHGQALITKSRGKSYQRSSRTMVDPELVESPRESSGHKNDDNTAAMVQNNDNVVLINEKEECMHLAGVESGWSTQHLTMPHRDQRRLHKDKC
ncbi:hypothetical protein KY290_022037 [Solanum tuberosum]|uniref:Retrovirus-related Pol polyprotein from transposon TNT 1-94 n=1 Tax=Solanum tuberosum TaxID=4113 RepID=A0ABQ7V4U7_SOLTU|nr:hypothetical protein KY289_022536 [Solanum tuberosum]KAH0758544.1 hypothetical protein KY290_022037 [Solanum tuberosum]